MMRGALFGMALILANAAPVAAAPPPAGIDPIALQAMQKFAQCMVEDNPRGVSRVLAMEMGTPAYHLEMQTLSHDSKVCLDKGRLKFNEDVLGGLMAEHVIARRFGLANLPRMVAYREGTKPIRPHDMGEYVDLCVVRAKPEAVTTLLGTPLGSPAESEALHPLVAALGDCMPNGKSIQFNRIGLRSGLALASYHLAQQNSAAPVPAGI